MRRGLNVWGSKGESAVFAELQQLHLRKYFQTSQSKFLSPLQNKQTLESHLFLKEKRDLTIKGCLVAGGDKQRSLYTTH